jgi:hypothetical protein
MKRKLDLLTLIRGLTPASSPPHGFVVLFSDIFEAARDRGLDNKDILEAELAELEKAGCLELITLDESIVGLKLRH